MNKFKCLTGVSPTDLISQWDDLAAIRDNQLRSHIDISFNQILKPFFISTIEKSKYNYILDFGCGTGVLTEEISRRSLKTVAIDISPKSIAIAKNSTTKTANTEYIHSDINNIKNSYKNMFDLVVANMTMQDVINLKCCIEDLFEICKTNSSFVFTITHPWFWPMYWGYHNEKWFNYNDEIAIEAPFRITNDLNNPKRTIHFHRPLHVYIKTITDAGFIIDSINELHSNSIDTKQYPKFLAISCKKI